MGSKKKSKRAQGKLYAKKELERLLNLTELELEDEEPEALELSPKLSIPPQLHRWQFIEGRKYRIHDRVGAMATLRFLRDEGIHHIFQSLGGGWLTSYTDSQLVGIWVAEC